MAPPPRTNFTSWIRARFSRPFVDVVTARFESYSVFYRTLQCSSARIENWREQRRRFTIDLVRSNHHRNVNGGADLNSDRTGRKRDVRRKSIRALAAGTKRRVCENPIEPSWFTPYRYLSRDRIVRAKLSGDIFIIYRARVYRTGQAKSPGGSTSAAIVRMQRFSLEIGADARAQTQRRRPFIIDERVTIIRARRASPRNRANA